MQNTDHREAILPNSITDVADQILTEAIKEFNQKQIIFLDKPK
jgi:hypothetical protein